MLEEIEKLRTSPYDDQTGKTITAWCEGATIGYGHLILSSEWLKYKNGISKDAASALFKTDLVPYVNSVNTKVTSIIEQNQFDALVIFVFNIGVPSFEKSSVLKLVNDPDAATPYKDLESAWKIWNKSQGIINNGLINRRKVEWKIYTESIYQKW